MTVAPTIHMNGTPVDHFKKHLSDAAMHLRRAQESLKQTAPHMRDYYVKPDGGQSDFEVACVDHGWRMMRIDQVLDSIHGLQMAIYEQERP